MKYVEVFKSCYSMSCNLKKSFVCLSTYFINFNTIAVFDMRVDLATISLINQTIYNSNHEKLLILKHSTSYLTRYMMHHNTAIVVGFLI